MTSRAFTAIGAVAVAAAAIFTSSTITAAPAPAVPAIQFADAYVRVEAGPDGKPRMECNQFHDGAKVSTEDDGRVRKFICRFHDPIFGKGYWIWTELTLG